ncbi:MAG: hypothetical protein ABW067_13915, partial [Rhizobacter sp.]
MTTTLATRKPVDELTAADLEAFPIWEYCDEEEGNNANQDETWVRPVDCEVLPRGASLSVAASVRLACGLVFPAVLFCDVNGDPQVDFVALLTEKGRVFFHYDASGTIRELKRLGLKSTDVFPLEYSVRLPSASG